jgi:selenide,water dikinase
MIGDGKIGLDTPDCSAVSIPNSDKVLVSTCDFFYPLVDDPYNQGRIAACNVLSDLYAMGIVQVDTVLMILGVSTKMTELEKDVTNSLLIKGFSDACHEAGTAVTGGQTVFNPWVLIGGTAMATIKEKDLIRPNNAIPGDVLILTKPLGAQLVVNFNQWLKLNNDKWLKVKEQGCTSEEILDSYEKGIKYMSTLNINGAKLMQKYKASAATDVTGFGIKGHAQNLAVAQRAKVDLVINKYPVIGNLYKFDKIARDFKLKAGTAAETSGGLLICLAKEKAKDFLGDYKSLTGDDAWIVGEVVKGENKVIIDENVEFIPV